MESRMVLEPFQPSLQTEFSILIQVIGAITYLMVMEPLNMMMILLYNMVILRMAPGFQLSRILSSLQERILLLFIQFQKII